MGASRSPAELVRKLENAARSVESAGRAGVRSAALAATTVIRHEVAAVVPSGRLSGVGKSGAKVSVGFDVKGTTNPTALIRARGPLHLVENKTKPHPITPKRRRGGAGKVGLRLKDGNVRSAVNHPGTKGQRPFAKGTAKAGPPAAAAFNAAIRGSMVRSFR